MLKPTIKTSQLGIFGSLADQLDQKHPLFLLANNIEWTIFEDAFKVHYSSKMGAPSKPIRLMVSLLILKYLRNLSDENLVEQYRLSKNYLKGILGDNMNVIFAAAAMNFKRRMILWRTEANLCWVLFFKYIQGVYWNFYALFTKRLFEG